VDITLVDAEFLKLKHGERFAASTISLPRSPGPQLQKTAHTSEQEPPDVAALRQAWFEA